MILPPNKFTGNITVGNLCAEISLTACIEDSGKLVLEIDPIANSDRNSMPIRQMMYDTSRWQGSVKLDCKNARGDRLVSNKFYPKKCESSENFSIEIQPFAVSFFIKSEEVYEHSIVKFHVLGVKCTRRVSCETELGLIEVHYKRDKDGLGVVQLTSKSEIIEKGWFKKSNALLIRIVNILGLACGHRVWIPLVEIRAGSRIKFTWNKVSLDHQSDKMEIMDFK